MARIDKTACDVCAAEHKTEAMIRQYAEPGTWLRLHLDVTAFGTDSEHSHALDVCDRDSCITAGLALLVDHTGKSLVAELQKSRQRRLEREAKQPGGAS